MKQASKYFILFLIAYLFTVLIPSVQAFDSTRPNNKFGIHLLQPTTEDIKAAAELVNSNGGSWGYVTLVIQENDRDKNKWQEVFDSLRENHLIPIVRLATQPEGESWKRASKEDAAEWANFLNSLHWVIKNRYIILFNEVNHASEWGGTVDVQNYTEVAYTFAQKLKEKNPDFVVMLAGFDAAAPQQLPTYASESYYLQTMISSIQNTQYANLFDYIDAWSSHSYPNPGFSGSPWGTGRNSIRNYQWELDYLRSLGIAKDLPVFITETGWLNPVPSGHFANAYENAWLPDDRVMAVTPFVFNYIGEPFSRFSWKQNEQTFYPHYYEVRDLEKRRGDPEIIDVGFLAMDKPEELVVNSAYDIPLILDNKGQAIWDASDGYDINIEPQTDLFSVSHSLVKALPLKKTQIILHIKTNGSFGKTTVELGLYKQGKKVATAGSWNVEILPPPTLSLQANLLAKSFSQPFTAEVQIFDKNEYLVFKRTDVEFKNGIANIEYVPGVIFGPYYRAVVVKPYYLPRQNYVKFVKGQNAEVQFEQLMPVDLNNDGQFSFGDIQTFITNPSLLQTLLGK